MTITYPIHAMTEGVRLARWCWAGGRYSLGLINFHRGDLNCDGSINFGDINPFVLALTNWGAYLQEYPNCGVYLADIDGNGYVDFGDINPFVALLSGQGY